MFHTSIRAMESAADELQRQLRKLNQVIETVQDVRNSMSGLSGMEDDGRKLDREISEMGQERGKLFSLLTVLRQGARCYDICERGVVEYAENGRRRMAVPDWYMVDLGSEAMEMVKQIIF
ncbi:MAG: hypothetical protein K2K63_18130 [Acetatifactor sp.]|nr:hypothetical protein [Acetatifactor sp.]